MQMEITSEGRDELLVVRIRELVSRAQDRGAKPGAIMAALHDSLINTGGKYKQTPGDVAAAVTATSHEYTQYLLGQNRDKK